MLIAQISDFHIVEPGQLAYGRVDTRAMLASAVEVINRLDPVPDLVIASGDLVQSGAPAEYAELRRLLTSLRMPLLPVAGNHDARDVLLSTFADGLPPIECRSFVQYVHDQGELRIIVLDSITPGSDDASFCVERAEWLRRTLAADRRPALLVIHHQPFMTGIPWMDPPTLNWTAPLGDAIAGSGGKVVGIISGHIHRAIHTCAFGVPVSSCPSTAHQVAADFLAAEPLLSMEAPGFQLHRWDGAKLTTYTISLERTGETFEPRP